MTSQKVLYQVADRAKISRRYINARGDETSVSDQTIFRILTALGYDISDDARLLKSAEKKERKEVLQPVLVTQNDGDPIEIELHLGVSARESEFCWQVETEQGQRFEGYVQSQIIRDERDDGGPLVFQLPSLPWGYHSLSVTRKRRRSPYAMKLIVTPSSCYKQEPLKAGKKLWGVSVQLYTLRSHYNWGIGDFGDLKQLVTDVAVRGGDFIGLNPIHSLFPANPEGASPYSPSSRRWLNVLYIDVSAVPEFVLSVEAQQKVGRAEFQQQLKKVRESHWVNYSEVAKLKLSVLPLLFNEFKTRHLEQSSERALAFLSFVELGGESLLHQAAFDALHSVLHREDDSIWGWPVFPDKYRHFDKDAVKTFIEEEWDTVQFYMYLQWLADGQVNEVQQLAQEKGMVMGLYRDLAVGVADSGAETWADRGNLMLDTSIGAPPDILGPLGQNWGLPPLNPEVLKATGYDAYIHLLQANMKHCGALRIDHVLGLLRLWLVPKGENAANGAYLYYPVEDMLAILALESHRNQCSVIGEDLGTVPVEIVDMLAKAGIHSYKVFFFETAEDGGYFSPAHYSAQSMSVLCTHDMPTLRGFWNGDDLKLGSELGLYPDKEQLKLLFDSRLHSKQEILNSVSWHGFLPDEVGKDVTVVPMDRKLSEALQLHLAAGASALLSVQLEDWLEMDQPVNIPGTVDQYPNWRRKLSVDLDEMFMRDNVNHIAKKLTEVRGR
jgi:4-alpha-glucanotransferase